MSLLDQDNNVIPVCNVHDAASNAHFHVKDVAAFNTLNNGQMRTKSIAMIACITVCIFFCIFSLNFNVTGWGPGNVLTFGIGSVSLIAFLHFGKQWLDGAIILNNSRHDGTPCTVKSNNNDIIYCKNN